MDVELRIEELVLHGFPSGDRHRIAEEIQRELTRLANVGGVSEGAKSLAIRNLDGGAIHVNPGKTAGAEIARAVYGAIRPQLTGSPRRGADSKGPGGSRRS